MAAVWSHWRTLGLHLSVLLFGSTLGWIIAVALGFLLIWIFATVPGSGAIYGMLIPSGGDLPVLLAVGWLLGMLVTYRIVALMLK